MMTAEPMRVRALLSALNSVEKTTLKKLLPPRIAANPPEEPADTKYPSALLSVLPKEECYSLAGWITEDLLRFPPVEVTPERLLSVIAGRYETPLSEAAVAKLLKSKTTEPYLSHIRETRKLVRRAARGPLTYEAAVCPEGPVTGHPDIRTPTQIFEVKMTGQLKQNWVDFLFQVFAYAALSPEVTDIYLVLPLQEILWHHDVRTWTTRAEYRAFLETAATKITAGAPAAAALIDAHRIGEHISKQKTLTATVASLPHADRPYQIFLSGPQNTRFSVDAADCATAAASLATERPGNRLFVHSQYLINLCVDPADPSNEPVHTGLLMRNLRAAVAAGFHGVVVHVGKSTTKPMEEALANMRANLTTALSAATPTCPILLETPAGQGTEVLRTYEEFVGFVAAFADPRIRICVDTCHVFACGHDPCVYVRRLIAEHPGLLRLLHFNDSATACGSCLDRHAFIGAGHIGIAGMTEIATTATAAALPMVIEY